MSAARLGWLGGTFDPIHNGHLDVAAAARAALDLSHVFLVPARIPPHRGAPMASTAHRLAMVKLAAETQEWLSVSEIELDAPGPSYTMDTLDRLESQGIDLKSLHVITGADAFADIFTWKGAPDLLDRCPFVVVSRPGYPAPDLRQALPTLAPRMVDAKPSKLTAQPPTSAPHATVGKCIFLVDAPTAPVTSTEVRTRASSRLSLGELVPETVASYINEHGLYQGVA